MKEIIDLNEILESFIKVEKPSLLKKLTGKNEVRQDLEKRRELMILTKDLLKTSAYKHIIEKKLITALKTGFGQILRATPQDTSETALWGIIAQMKAYLGMVADLKYNIEAGEAAARKLQ